MFRIYRDVRFSKDKSPYKTHAALWIYHRAPGRGVGKEIDGGAGFYVHLEPDASLVAAGLWMPPRPSLAKVREHFGEDLAGWKRAVTASGGDRSDSAASPTTRTACCSSGCRVGSTEGHPAERWLRFNSFTMSRAYARRRHAVARARGQGDEGFRVAGADVPVAESGAGVLAGEEPLRTR